MRTIETLGQELGDGGYDSRVIEDFRRLRHFIGRLAAHIRVPQQLIQDSKRLQPLLDVYTVAPVGKPVCVSLPAADAHTNLDGILKRMLPAGDQRYDELRGCLGTMDRQVGLQDAILSKLGDRILKPLVHAEVQVLDHFNRQQLKFVVDDRYIAASKPACLCCKLYFRYHQLGCVEVDSHEKIYLNWGPAYLPGGVDDPEWICQRDILNSMKNDIGRAALDQISRLSVANFAQADSLTQITDSGDEFASSGSGNETAQEDEHSDSNDGKLVSPMIGLRDDIADLLVLCICPPRAYCRSFFRHRGRMGV